MSRSVWGWETGYGITGFILGFVILSLAITPLFVPVIQDWSWIGSFITAILGILTMILALLWLLGSPSDEVPPLLFQGASIGPYVYLTASFLTLGGSVTEGVFNPLPSSVSLGPEEGLCTPK